MSKRKKRKLMTARSVRAHSIAPSRNHFIKFFFCKWVRCSFVSLKCYNYGMIVYFKFNICFCCCLACMMISSEYSIAIKIRMREYSSFFEQAHTAQWHNVNTMTNVYCIYELWGICVRFSPYIGMQFHANIYVCWSRHTLFTFFFNFLFLLVSRPTFKHNVDASACIGARLALAINIIILIGISEL